MTDTTKTEWDVIFDDGGGITLQWACGEDRYCHVYDDGGQAADDIMAIIDGVSPINDGWDNNQLDCWLEWGDDARALQNSGSIKWYRGDRIQSIIADKTAVPGWGGNVCELFTAMGCEVIE